MSDDLKILLEASVTIAQLRKELAAKDALIASIRREVGLARLKRDLEFDLSADQELSMFHRRQI